MPRGTALLVLLLIALAGAVCINEQCADVIYEMTSIETGKYSHTSGFILSWYGATTILHYRSAREMAHQYFNEKTFHDADEQLTIHSDEGEETYFFSPAIHRILSDRFNLLPTDPKFRLQAEALVDYMNYLRREYGELRYIPDYDDRELVLQEIDAEVLELWTTIEQLLERDNSLSNAIYMFNSPTPGLVDFELVGLLSQLLSEATIEELAEPVAAKPRLKELIGSLLSNPRIREVQTLIE